MKPRKPEETHPPSAEPDSLSHSTDLTLTSALAPRPRLKPLESLNEEILALLRRNMTEQPFVPDELLMKQGDPGTSLMVVAAGEAEVSIEKDGTRRLLKRVGPGEILGEMALLTKEPRMATVTALTKGRAWVLSADRFDELAAADPRISTLLTLLLASRLGTLQHDAMTGNTFHGYRIQRCLGHGGMSVVYEAEDSRTQRRVALKMMSHRLLYDPAAMQHFQREADIVESFDHPNIAKMYGRFEAFRTSFIIMELCEGISISEAMASGKPLPEPVVRRILGQAACAIAYFHEAGIVHRDIKPSNLMVTREGTVKLIDFGLAGQVDKESLAPALFGTPQYMAPEQMAGEPVGKKIDLFALGQVAFEMLTGRRLFEGRSFRSLRSEVLKCRTPDFMTSFPEFSQEIRRVLHGLLLRDPESRHLDFDLVRSWAAPVDDGRFLGR